MTLQQLLDARWHAGRAVIADANNRALKEGAVHERARLFDGIRLAWWKREAKRLTAKVLDEARMHEETARMARLDAVDHLTHEWDALVRDAQTALIALGTIANGQCEDETEVASQALDVLRGSMARYSSERVVLRDETQLVLGIDASGFHAGVELAIREMQDRRHGPAAYVRQEDLGMATTDGDDATA